MVIIRVGSQRTSGASTRLISQPSAILNFFSFFFRLCPDHPLVNVGDLLALEQRRLALSDYNASK